MEKPPYCKAYAEYVERREAERQARAKTKRTDFDFQSVRRDHVVAIALNGIPAAKRKHKGIGYKT